MNGKDQKNIVTDKEKGKVKMAIWLLVILLIIAVAGFAVFVKYRQQRESASVNIPAQTFPIETGEINLQSPQTDKKLIFKYNQITITFDYDDYLALGGFASLDKENMENQIRSLFEKQNEVKVELKNVLVGDLQHPEILIDGKNYIGDPVDFLYQLLLESRATVRDDSSNIDAKKLLVESVSQTETIDYRVFIPGSSSPFMIYTRAKDSEDDINIKKYPTAEDVYGFGGKWYAQRAADEHLYFYKNGTFSLQSADQTYTGKFTIKNSLVILSFNDTTQKERKYQYLESAVANLQDVESGAVFTHAVKL